MSMNPVVVAMTLSAWMLAGGAAGAAETDKHQRERQYVMTQHVREEVRGAQSVGSLPPDEVLRFDMLLPLSSPRSLDQFLAEAYDPASASYRKFLTPAEFTARFGPAQADWDELVRFAKQSGFSITGGTRDEMDLRVAAPVHAIEAAFHVKMRVYEHPTEHRTFYSPDTEPTIAMEAAVWHVSGLDNFSTPRARVRARRSAVTAMTTTGACPGNSYCGSDMRSAYYGGGALTGTGQSIGLVEFYGYDSADLNTYFSTSGQTNNVPVNGISTDGTALACLSANGCDDTEQTLDMTQALGMAPGLAQLNVYVGSSDTAILSAMSVPAPRSVTGKVDAQLSCSWGWGPADPSTDDPLFKKFAAQGQTFLTAAGDSGAYSPSSEAVFPADDAFVTVVGGTDLYTAGPAGAWQFEGAWSDGGGGYFAPDNIPIPAWQTAAIAVFNAASGNAGSTSLRNSPDVAGQANFDFYVCADQTTCSENLYGGTSFAAPMWAGYMALANQQAAINRAAPVGFLNPTIYALGEAGGSGYALAFHDITGGSNGYSAVTGYDIATGWGSPNGAGLINALAGAAVRGFSLTAGGSVSVPDGGSGTVTLTTVGSGGFNSNISLSAAGLPSGVTVSFRPASIAGSGATSVIFQAADNAAAGSYAIVLTGKSGTLLRSASVSLTVGKASFSIVPASPTLVAMQGATGSVALSVAVSGALAHPIALSVSGQPAGVAASLSAVSIVPPGVVALTLRIAATAAPGSYRLTVTASSGGVIQKATVTLTIATAVRPTFDFGVDSSQVTVARGTTSAFTVQSESTGAAVPIVSLSVAGLPAGVTARFSPATITGSGSSTVTLGVAPSASLTRSTLTFSGTAGGSTQSATVTLNVN